MELEVWELIHMVRPEQYQSNRCYTQAKISLCITSVISARSVKHQINQETSSQECRAALLCPIRSRDISLYKTVSRLIMTCTARCIAYGNVMMRTGQIDRKPSIHPYILTNCSIEWQA